MKEPYRMTRTCLLCVAISALILCGPSSPGAEPFVVVELFTSEGCSSCPPADRLLGEIAEKAKKDGSRIFPMAFHVDYWNRLGWHDPFSDPAYSERQRQYARALGSPRRIYTPQMIVNGVEGFVGSRKEQAYSAINAMLKDGETKIELVLEARIDGDGKRIEVSYRVEGAPEQAILNVALLEDGISNEIPRGENAGRRLSHERVVRGFKTASLEKAAEGTLEFPYRNPSIWIASASWGFCRIVNPWPFSAPDVPNFRTGEKRLEMTYRLGLVGCGSMGRNHLDTVAYLPQVEVSAICDVVPEALQQTGEAYRVEARYADFDRMYDEVKPDIVTVATQTRGHHAPTVAALERGISVLCEKPIAIDLVEADEMVESAASTNAKLAVNHQNHFNPGILKAKSLVEEGQIGEIVMVRGATRRGEGAATSSWKWVPISRI